jgi:hypothetical protein
MLVFVSLAGAIGMSIGTVTTRRSFVARFVGSICCATSLGIGSYVPTAHASIPSASLTRWTNAYDELKNLDKNWDTIVTGEHDGDSIRRKLGTVYAPPTCSSPLCSFSNFVPKFMVEYGEDIDIDEFEAPSQELLLALNEANSAAYNAIFCPEFANPSASDYIKTSRKQVQRSITNMKQIINILEAVK